MVKENFLPRRWLIPFVCFDLTAFKLWFFYRSRLFKWLFVARCFLKAKNSFFLFSTLDWLNWEKFVTDDTMETVYALCLVKSWTDNINQFFLCYNPISNCISFFRFQVRLFFKAAENDEYSFSKIVIPKTRFLNFWRSKITQ